jgi:four helix bundle protein
MFVFEKSVKYGNAVLEKSFDFSIRIIKLYEYLIKKNRNVEPLLKQFLRSGTSIGANITEAQSAYTKKDFINKLGISLKEARESEYWIRLLSATNYLDKKESESIQNDCEELIKLLTTIIKNSKNNI